MKKIAVGILLAALAATAVWQAKTIRQLRSAVLTDSAKQSAPSDAAPEPTSAAPRVERATRSAATDGLSERITTLEKQVAQLTQNSEYLMTRGQLPLAPNKRSELEQTFLNASASERDRLQALRLLRRNGGLSDSVLQQALSWLQTSTNNGVREDLVRQLQGVTNGPVREPLLKLAASDTNEDVRREAVQALRGLLTDPQVESLMWELALKDSDPRVREEAEQTLREGQMTDARRAALKQRALDPNSSLDERLIAVRALRESGDGAAEAATALAQFAQTTQNPAERARVFRAFDGSTDPSMKLPLVYGLQDPDPIVRERAADALSGYKADPAIVQWLKWVVENDTDPRVRREASQALNDRR
jgi:HEAT repeat protein